MFTTQGVAATTWPNWIDLVILGLAFRGCYVGFCRGVAAEVVHLVGLIGATLITAYGSGRLVNWITPWWRYDPQILDLCSVAVLFLLVMWLAHVVARRGAELLTRERLHWASQGVGMVVGSVRSLWWAGVILLFLLAWNQPYLTDSVTERSLMGPSLVKHSRTHIRWLLDRMPGGMRREELPLVLRAR